MDLREVAEELYASAPAAFVERRSAAAQETDDRDLARRIRALRKPTASAAALNALMRNDPEAVHDVLEIGDRLRDAFAARDRAAIRELTRERQRLLQAATRGLGLSAAVAREVEETLQAAVVDPAAAAAVRSGMLLRSLESTGVDEVDVSDAVALPVDTSAAPSRRPPRSAKQAAVKQAAGQTVDEAPRETASERRERQRRIRTAQKALERARADADGLDDELDAEVDRRTDLEGERDTLERRLERTTEELAEARAVERDLRRRIAAAQAALRDAERALRDARADA
ncbi:hypothetical protein IT072_19590 [Leifsonia sp. ZF2019]|uniref:hypothetical protein n=1 Tax=Leifsonia sp. ZF2019 TaxID=2781978 RepID=UPI001CBD05A1|nr:hypothetical protein [Leifsonia sp. ZF2019]UAJ79361.1 hypothetical protein IT072_19590 [Leifsonia sp. ZF2019]